MESIESKLRRLLIALNLELYMTLERSKAVNSFLGKYKAEPFPEDALTSAVYPSHFSYLKDLLEEEFALIWLTFTNNGILNYELLNLCERCRLHFERFNFPDNEEDRMLRYLIIGEIADYLEGGNSDGI